MMQDDCSRRVFLKKFALLSAGSLVLGATAMACYGAMPAPPEAEVSGMFFLDAASNPVPLQNNQGVPVHTRFTIEFSAQMDTTAPAAVAFTDHNNAPVLFDNTWDNDFTLGVAPASNLLFNTVYSLRVQDARSRRGTYLIQNGNETATFKTAEA
jgi:Big-like domain-containing protein